MSEEKNSLDILLESLTDEQWSEISLRAQLNRAHKAAERFKSNRDSAIKFSEWILEHNVPSGHNNEGSPCWLDPRNNINTYTTVELYNIYKNGDWEVEEEEYDDDDISNII